MTLLESVLLAAGALLLGRFSAETLLPRAARTLRARSVEQAGSLREEFVFVPPAVLLGSSVASGAAAFLVLLRPAGTVAAAAAGGAVSLLLPPLLVTAVRRRRRDRLCRQLPTALRLLSSSVRAGNSFPQAMARSAALFPEEMRAEGEWFCRRHGLGIPPWEILREWEERVGRDEFRLVLRPLRMAVRSGGNAAELLDRCRHVLECRRRGEERMAALTAQGRTQALVLSLLPPVFLALLSRVDPGSVARLVGTGEGRAILGTSILLQAAGWFAVRRIARFTP